VKSLKEKIDWRVAITGMIATTVLVSVAIIQE